MATDDIDREEVDRLVKELASRTHRPVSAPPVTKTVDSTPVASLGELRSHAPGRRWSTARLLMPEATSRNPRRLAFANALESISLPRFDFPSLASLRWEVITARMFVGLGLALSLAMMFWPYNNTCSWGLYLYLAAVLLVIITGVWGAKLTWDMELGAAHTLALCTVFWGLTLVAAEVLPRVGYAQVQQPWFCAG